MPKIYWSQLNRLISKKNGTNIPSLLENGQFVTNVESKANMFNEYFVAKCREVETGSSILTFISQFQIPLSNMSIDRDKVFRLITSLDTTVVRLLTVM